MTRDGLVERGSDGEDRRISRRELDFDLRGESAQEPPERASPKGKRKQKQMAHPRDSEAQADDREPEEKRELPDDPGASSAADHNADTAPDTESTSRDNSRQTGYPSDKSSGEKRTGSRTKSRHSIESHTIEYELSTTYAASPEHNSSDISTESESGASESESSALGHDQESGYTDDKLSHLQERADRADTKLDKARKKIPKKRKPTVQRCTDPVTGNASNKLQFEETPLPPHGERKTPLPVKAVASVSGGVIRAAANTLHKKVRESEHENVGIEAAHKTEIAAEGLIRGGSKVTRSAFRFARNKPYRRVSALERQAEKAHSKLTYKRAAAQQPAQKQTGVIARFIQRQSQKRKHAQAARETQKTAQTVQTTANTATKIAKSASGFLQRHPLVIGGVAIGFAFIMLFSTTLSACTNLATGIGGSIFLASYTADDADIDNAELIYSEWETDLEISIMSAEYVYSGYDEYRRSVGEISHNPYELTAFLTAVYGDFKYRNIVDILREVFEEQYVLSYMPEIETRYADPDDEDGDGDYEPYEWRVLNITLTSKSFTTVAYTRMDDAQRELYNLYMQTKGNRQYLDSPFDFNWLPYVSSYYGYRVHPISGDKNYHKGLDIGVASGTEIHAGHSGTVTFAGYDSGFGNFIVLDDGKGLVSQYAHCSSLLVHAGQTVEAGDVIALVGSTGNSTGPHLHLEIIMNGQYLNPIYCAETNDDGSGPSYGNPGSPMGDGSYAAMLEEAEKYLGYPYVWGGSTPSTSFDCSGFVCWVINQSGVGSVGRTTAQGLYNLCTPVSPGEAQPGDLIFFQGTYSTTDTVTHVGIYVGDNLMINAGNPIKYERTDSPGRLSHFYSFGRLPAVGSE